MRNPQPVGNDRHRGRAGARSLAVVLLAAHAGAVSAAPTLYGEPGEHVGHASGPHPHDELKRREHVAVMELVASDRATDLSARSGAWSDPATWQHGRVPERGARVWIQSDHEIRLARRIDDAWFHWVRVDGTLAFDGDVDTRLRVGTLVVGEPGRLEIGTAQRPVRQDRTAELVFADLGPRDRREDPFDIGRGLVCHGALAIHGSPRASHAVPGEALRAGLAALSFAEAPGHWRVGDRLLFPASDLAADRDELRRIAALSSDGRRIELDRPLQWAHPAPEGMRIPVGNLTRNVVLRSENPDELERRGHFMVMHTHRPVTIDGAAFLDLGRTDARRAHTIPDVDADGRLVPGSDANTQGRYALHFHLRSGAERGRPPHVVRNSAIVGSPKHGLVNHGGHVLAEGNVGFGIDGSHFFAENGTEIGRFAGNLAVRSRGSRDAVTSREGIHDFGHQGHGFWSQSGGVEIVDNWAFGHADAAFAIFTRTIEEGGRWVRLPGALAGEPAVSAGREWVDPGEVPFHFAGNVAAASKSGLEVWYSKVYARHDVASRVESSVFFALREHGLFLPYTKGLVLRSVRVLGDVSSPVGIGIRVNDMTESIQVEDARIEGFHVGVEVPPRGHNRIARSLLNDTIDVWVGSANRPGRRVELVDNQHGRLDPDALSRSRHASAGSRLERLLRTVGLLPQARQYRIWMARPAPPSNGDVSVLFAADPVIETRAGRTRQVYSLAQQADAVLEGTGHPGFECRTVGEILAAQGLAVGGTLAPAGAQREPDVHGLVGPVTERYAAEPVPPRSEPGPYGATFSVVAPEPGRAEWIVQQRGGPESQGVLMAYNDGVAPEFHASEGMRFEIHPDDVKYGHRVDGLLHDRVGTKIAKTAFSHDFRNLEVDPDGIVRIPILLEDDAGNQARQTIELRVSEDAPRRGANTTHFMQREYCPACGDPSAADRLRFLLRRVESWWPAPAACEPGSRDDPLATSASRGAPANVRKAGPRG